MASGGLLSLKWNNHKSTFFHVLSTIRSKEAYCDATIACDGRFYPVHKLIMSTCSDYFEEMFERANCKHPVIVLKDIRHEDLEALLNYMYVGEVNVLQNELAGLIKAAECLQIKGLAVPDEAPTKEFPKKSKRGIAKEDSPQSKRRKRDDSDSGRYISDNNARSSSQNQLHRESSSSSNHRQQSPRRSSSISGQAPSFRRSVSSPHHTPESLPDDYEPIQSSSQDDNFQKNDENTRIQDMPSSQSHTPVPHVVLDEPPAVKEEPEEIQEVEEVQEDIKNVLEASFADEHMSEEDFMSNIGDSGSQGAQGFDAQMMSGAPQSMEELVAQAMPGSSGMQEVIDGCDSRILRDRTVTNNPQIIKQGRNLICSVCSYQTLKKQHLERHMLTHTGEKPFACPYCPYRATQKASLQIHIRTHTGEKPFACSYCPYRSSQKGSLTSHVQANHFNKQ